MNVSKDPEWRRFASVIEQIDGGIDARAYNYIMTGTFAFSLIGKRLGHYDLRYRRMNRSGLGDIRWKPVADIAIIRSVEAAAREYNRRKLAPLEKPGAPVALPPALFGVRGPELQDYLEDLLQNS
ncbi:hypothetical protein CAP39_01555 [Sphingomonas sp. IBVSS1]|nr:hypothetical protein CAP39_01555 [Sphingomonas sp. IBVSS1]